MVFANYKTVFRDNELMNRLRNIRHIAFDMDGTIYLGSMLFPYTIPFLNDLKQLGVGYTFLTNNPSKSILDYISKLDELGIATAESEIYTTILATIDYLKKHHPNARKLYLLGTESMISEFEKAGYESVGDIPEDQPDVVVVAFDMSLKYERLCRAAWWISQGLPYIATNPDRVCPTNEQNLLVDCGSICACLESATDRMPDMTLGKPDPTMLEGIVSRHNLHLDEIMVVGDRLYTDIAMAHNAGVMGVLVLSGETVLSDLDNVLHQPELTVDHIGVLNELMNHAFSLSENEIMDFQYAMH